MESEKHQNRIRVEENLVDLIHGLAQKHLWERAEFVARVDLFNVKVTQVSERGFYFHERGEYVPKFHPWPQSRKAGAGEDFGRV